MSTVPGKSTSGEDRNVTSTILGPNEHHERFSSLTKTTSSKQNQNMFSGSVVLTRQFRKASPLTGRRDGLWQAQPRRWREGVGGRGGGKKQSLLGVDHGEKSTLRGQRCSPERSGGCLGKIDMVEISLTVA